MLGYSECAYGGVFVRVFDIISPLSAMAVRPYFNDSVIGRRAARAPRIDPEPDGNRRIPRPSQT